MISEHESALPDVPSDSRIWKLFPLFAILAFIAYSPAFFTEFAMHNDYLAPPPDWKLYYHYETFHLLVTGKPLQALLINGQYQLARTIHAFQFCRFLGFLLALVLACQLLVLMRKRYSGNPLTAVSMVFCLIMLPPIQLAIVWWSNLIPGILSAILVTLSYAILQKTNDADRNVRPSCQSALYHYIAAGIIFMLALLIFPATAMFVFSLIIMEILFSPLAEWPVVRKNVIRHGLFFATLAGAYLLIILWVIFPMLMNLPIFKDRTVWFSTSGLYTMAITTDLIGKTTYFIDLSSMVWSLTYHLLFGAKAAFVVGGLLVVSASVTLRHAVREAARVGSPVNRTQARLVRSYALQKICATVCALLALNGPLLVAAGVSSETMEYRHATAYYAAVLIIVFWPFHYWSQEVRSRRASALAKALALVLTVISVWVAYKNTLDVSRNLNLELSFFRQRIADADMSRTRSMTVILLPKMHYLIPETLRFDFRFMATNHGFMSNIVGIVCRELQVPVPEKVTAVSPGSQEANQATANRDHLVLDLNEAIVKTNHHRERGNGSGWD